MNLCSRSLLIVLYVVCVFATHAAITHYHMSWHTQCTLTHAYINFHPHVHRRDMFARKASRLHFLQSCPNCARVSGCLCTRGRMYTQYTTCCNGRWLFLWPPRTYAHTKHSAVSRYRYMRPGWGDFGMKNF